VRLFIAVKLNEEMRTALTLAQAALRKAGVRGRFTPEENLHLTLAFLGERPDPESVLDVMADVPFRAFPLRLDGLGCFGDTWWAGLRESDELAAYAGKLRRALAEAGIPFDRKRFRPHITLLRRAVFPDGAPPAGLSAPEASMTVRRVSLMRSERGRRGMIYTEQGFTNYDTEERYGIF